MDGSLLQVAARYFRIWRRTVALGFSVIAVSRIDLYTFVFGKLVRMGFFCVFVLALFDHTPTVAGYEEGEVLLFFALMNLIDIVTQMVWFRGFTDLARLVRNGDFDLVLTKPISPLFWSAFRIFDLFDLLTVPAALAFLWFAIATLNTPITFANALLGMLLLGVSIVLAFSLNLFLASLNFVTVELENAWWMYRDLVYVARFPPEVFPIAIQFVFTYLFPILVIIAFPTKAFLGLMTPWGVAWALFSGLAMLQLALFVWNRALRHYASASA